jgi:hypothetical protein
MPTAASECTIAVSVCTIAGSDRTISGSDRTIGGSVRRKFFPVVPIVADGQHAG